MEKLELSLYWHAGRTSWFENYQPADYQLNKIREPQSIFQQKYLMFSDIVEDALRMFCTEPVGDGSGEHWVRCDQEEIEETVELCGGAIRKWATDYAFEVSEGGSDDLSLVRDGLTDFPIMSEILTLNTNDEDPDELSPTIQHSLPSTGRVIHEQQLFAALALWKVDHAMTAINASNMHAAMALAIDATRAVEAARTLFWERYGPFEVNVAQQLKSSFAAAGAKARDARYKPLRDYAVKLAREVKWKSKRQAVLSIAPKVVEHSRELGINLSEHQAERTISRWLTKSGLFASKRTTSTGKGTSPAS